MIQKKYMYIKSICGCISFNSLVAPYPYTHPIRPDNIGMVDLKKHESLCDIAITIRQDILSSHLQEINQSLDSAYDASSPLNRDLI
jgi:hypothetical protein